MWTREKQKILDELSLEREKALVPLQDALRDYFREERSGMYGSSACAVVERMIHHPAEIIRLLSPLVLPGE
jgi:hypothetical protein